MTTRCIDNFTPGSATSPYDTWAKAATTAALVDAIDAAGDAWYFDHRHSESTAGAVTINVAGSPTSPSQFVSVTQSGTSGASALTAGAKIATTGASNLIVNGSLWSYGVTLSAGSGSSGASLTLANVDGNAQMWESPTLILASTNAGNRISFGSSSANTSGAVTLRNPTFKFSNASQGVVVRHAISRINGGSIDGSGSAVNAFIASTVDGGRIVVTNFDFTNGATTMDLVGSSIGAGEFIFRYCKLPSTWSGHLFTGDPTNPGVRAEAHRCYIPSSLQPEYTAARDYAGQHTPNTANVRSGGATDGTTPIAWTVLTTANAEYPAIPFALIEIEAWNDTTGSSLTAEIEFLHDSLTGLTDAEIWMDIVYLGDASSTLGSLATCRVADILATPSAHASSSATWTTSGLTNPNKQKLSVSFTPQQKGAVIARVFVAKASYTVYVCPKLTLTGLTSSRQYITPGGTYINETGSSGGGLALPPVRMAA